MDRTIETDDGFDCIVNGKRFGTWRSRALAKAGMKVEQDRARVAEAKATLARYGEPEITPLC